MLESAHGARWSPAWEGKGSFYIPENVRDNLPASDRRVIWEYRNDQEAPI